MDAMPQKVNKMPYAFQRKMGQAQIEARSMLQRMRVSNVYELTGHDIEELANLVCHVTELKEHVAELERLINEQKMVNGTSTDVLVNRALLAQLVRTHADALEL